jgi:hypothetical protein
MKLRFLFLILVFALASAQGDPAEGKNVPPNGVAEMIVQRTDIALESLFDEMAMSSAASRLTMRELQDVVAYLRKGK